MISLRPTEFRFKDFSASWRFRCLARNFLGSTLRRTVATQWHQGANRSAAAPAFPLYRDEIQPVTYLTSALPPRRDAPHTAPHSQRTTTSHPSHTVGPHTRTRTPRSTPTNSPARAYHRCLPVPCRATGHAFGHALLALLGVTAVTPLRIWWCQGRQPTGQQSVQHSHWLTPTRACHLQPVQRPSSARPAAVVPDQRRRA